MTTGHGGGPGGPGGPSAALDARALARLEGLGGAALRDRVIALYLENAAARLVEARQAAARGDPAAARDALHALGSSAANVGAGEVARLAREGEAGAAGGDVRPLAGLLERLAGAAARAEEALAAVRGGGGDAPGATPEGAPAAAAAPHTVAVVEDNPDNRLLVRAILEPGCRVVEYATGGEAVAGCRAAPPDAILLDISLPDMDGVEVLRRLRREPALDRVPIIALTAHALPGARDEHLALGFDDYMAKPIMDFAALRALVARPRP